MSPNPTSICLTTTKKETMKLRNRISLCLKRQKWKRSKQSWSRSSTGQQLDRQNPPPATRHWRDCRKSGSTPAYQKFLLTLTEAQELTGLGRTILREAITQGKLKAKIIGKTWRVKYTDLERYIEKLF